MALILVLTNISGLAPVSSYRYDVLIGDGTPLRSTSIAHGELHGHARDTGWRALVQKLLDAQPS